MNSQQRFAMMYAAMSDDAWQVVIVNERDAMSGQLDFCDAYELGRLDALEDKPFRPGQYEHLTNQVEYAIGWVSEVGHNTMTWALLHPKPVRPKRDLETEMIQAELDDLLSGREDEEFARWGGN